MPVGILFQGRLPSHKDAILVKCLLGSVAQR